MDASHIHGPNAPVGLLNESPHGADVAHQHDACLRTLLELGEMRGGIRDGVELHGHLRGDAHAVELLLPFAGGDLVIDQHEEAEFERLSPSDHDLPVNESIVDAIQRDGHGFRRRRRPSTHDRARGRR